MLRVMFPPQLRALFPRSAQRQPNSRLSIRRLATQKSPRTASDGIQWQNRRDSIPVAPRRNPPPPQHPKGNTSQRTPERIVIYHGGTGRTLFIGMLRVSTIFIFGVSTFIIAPTLLDEEHPWYIGLGVAIGSIIPLIFVSYTAAPYVNFIQLELPIFARRSRQVAVEYAKNLPPTAKLYINTTGGSIFPRQAEVRLQDLVPDRSLLRPVSFRNRNPAPLSKWESKTLRHFYTAEKANADKPSSKYYPGVWESVYKQIQSQGAARKQT